MSRHRTIPGKKKKAMSLRLSEVDLIKLHALSKAWSDCKNVRQRLIEKAIAYAHHQVCQKGIKDYPGLKYKMMRDASLYYEQGEWLKQQAERNVERQKASGQTGFVSDTAAL